MSSSPRRTSGVLAACCVAPVLSGCWFVYIPGELMGSIADGLTGDKGQHCISAGAKVGDRIRTPGGGWATVQHISGESIRCRNPEHPIRAVVVFDP